MRSRGPNCHGSNDVPAVIKPAIDVIGAFLKDRRNIMDGLTDLIDMKGIVEALIDFALCNCDQDMTEDRSVIEVKVCQLLQQISNFVANSRYCLSIDAALGGGHTAELDAVLDSAFNGFLTENAVAITLLGIDDVQIPPPMKEVNSEESVGGADLVGPEVIAEEAEGPTGITVKAEFLTVVMDTILAKESRHIVDVIDHERTESGCVRILVKLPRTVLVGWLTEAGLGDAVAPEEDQDDSPNSYPVSLEVH